MSVEELRELADRLREGRLIAPAKTILIDGLGEMSTGETREVPHPDAAAAADAIEWLLSDRHQAEEAMREGCAKVAEERSWQGGMLTENTCCAATGSDIAAAIRSMEVE